MNKHLIDRLAEEWAQLDPVDPLRCLLSDAIDALKRKPLTNEKINLFINGQGEEDDEDYVEPTGDGFGLTDADLFQLVRRVEAAHGIKE